MGGLRLRVRASLIIAATLATHALADGSTDGQALLQALREANVAQAARLIDRQVNLNARDDTGATPLMWAVQMGDADLTARLLKAGADPNLRDHEGLGPLQIAPTARCQTFTGGRSRAF